MKATARVMNLIHGGLLQYAYGEDEEAARYLNRAKQLFTVYRRDLTSRRLDFPRTYPEMIQEVAEQIGPQMYPGSYNIIRKKIGLEPIENLPTTRPA